MSEKPQLHTATGKWQQQVDHFNPVLKTVEDGVAPNEMKKAAEFDSLQSKIDTAVRNGDFALPETLKNQAEGNLFNEEQVITFVLSLVESSSREAILKALIDTFGKKEYQE